MYKTDEIILDLIIGLKQNECNNVSKKFDSILSLTTREIKSSWNDTLFKLECASKLYKMDILERYQIKWMKKLACEHFGVKFIVNFETEFTNKKFVDSGVVTAITTTMGKRTYMEDTTCESKNGCFVFDGHGGKATSKFLEQNFKPEKFIDMTDKEIQAQFDRWNLKNMDKWDFSGSCLTGALYNRTGPIRVINMGDSRTIVLSNKKEIFSTLDHKPTDLKEKEYILKCDGFVKNKRVCGILAISRAFGDYRVCGVNRSAEFTTIDDGDVIISVSDGITDVMSNKDIVKIVNSELDRMLDPIFAADLLVSTALNFGSGDNLTATVTKRLKQDLEWISYINVPKKKEVVKEENKIVRAIKSIIKSKNDNSPNFKVSRTSRLKYYRSGDEQKESNLKKLLDDAFDEI